MLPIEEYTLKRFKEEVLDSESSSTLPNNLSDDWLCVLAEHSQRHEEADDTGSTTFILSAIVKILAAKQSNDNELSFTASEMAEYFDTYQIELSIEKLRRFKSMDITPASIKSIFTDRKMEYHF